MGAFVQFISDQEVTIKACGRACPDMSLSTLPHVPLPPPLSLAELMRSHPDMEFEREWLEAMETSKTVH